MVEVGIVVVDSSGDVAMLTAIAGSVERGDDIDDVADDGTLLYMLPDMCEIGGWYWYITVMSGRVGVDERKREKSSGKLKPRV